MKVNKIIVYLLFFMLFIKISGCSITPDRATPKKDRDKIHNIFNNKINILQGDPQRSFINIEWDWAYMAKDLNNKKWLELAYLTVEEGASDNLSYYFLGRSAEGLGYYEAAKQYYQLSLNYKNNSLSNGNFIGRLDRHCNTRHAEACSTAKDRLKILNEDSVDNVNTPTKIIRSFNQKSKTIKSKGDQYLINNNDSSYIDDLKVIKNLLDKGVINDNEFKTMKKNIIDKI